MNTAKLLTLILIVAFLSGCYRGDGKYTSEGLWPFVNYKVELPQFELRPGTEERFSLAGYKSHGRSLLRLTVRSSASVAFHEMDTIVEVRIADSRGTIYFHRNGPLNQHYLRMVSEGTASYANDTEWFARYQYGDPEYDKRVVPFNSSSTPTNLNEMVYWHFFPTESKNLHVDINVSGGSIDLEGVNAQISVSSGWK
ncbi:hypothetical protein WG68_18840 [Arsukibacterium ikkense]|uniref:Lipoprotein n=1 Tax=Arsukibacterium ikkense TaxID=336831 RepID=A0A0M2V0B0_9GAMM|nr:hypothetical protein [Arsukibacterium ikkense]KKO43799.1 hypothetical protein WG68_18840 [Arsukibacterium ikkense]